MRWPVVLVFLVAASCESGGDAGGGGEGSASGSATAPATAKRGSGQGFSAELAKDLAGEGSAGSAKAGSAVPATGSAGSAAKVDAKAGSAAPPVDAKAGSAKPDPKVDTKPDPKVDTKPDPKVDAKAGSAAAPEPVAIPKSKLGNSVVILNAPPAATPAAVPADLKAIKIQLMPNWERDLEQPGTLWFPAKIPGRSQYAVFVFHYGYEDASAPPTDRDAYKKWLAEKKILDVKTDRQRGAAWYLDGVDGAGRPAFRFVVNFGGKKLICHGLLYKDAASNALDELRDLSIVQAKQICETLAL